MPRHHYLPASYLGNFSEDKKINLRESLLFVKDLENGHVFKRTANDVGCMQNYYPEQVDKILGAYEPKLSIVIELLLQKRISAKDWASTLVRFVSGMLVRGPDFKERFEKRLEPLSSIPMNEDNTDYARWFENQRLLSVITAAYWIVMEKYGDDLIITNDIGYMIYGDANIHRLGYAIPINSQYILGIIPNLARPIAYSANKEWFPIINYVRLDHNNHQSYNERMCQFAARFIYCGSFETINKYPKAEKVKKIPLPEPAEIGFDQGQIAMAADMDWFKLLSLLSSDPDNEENWRHFQYEQYNDLSGDLLTDKDFVKLPGGFLRMGNVVYINLLGYSRSMC